MQRVTHVLRPNAASYQPQHRIYVDCEAHIERQPDASERQTLRFGWAVYERARLLREREHLSAEWLRFTTPGEFWSWAAGKLRRGTTIHIYAHNWDYDLGLLAAESELCARGFICQQYIRSSHFLRARFATLDAHLVLLDTLNYYPMPLELLGRATERPKLPMPSPAAAAGEWDTYCRRDVEVVRDAMHSYFAFVRDHDLGKLRDTAPAQALGAFRHRFMRDRILVLSEPAVEALERESLHGGRCEVWYDRPLSGPLYALDVNSLYPAVMAVERMPRMKWGKGRDLPPGRLASMLDASCAIARVYLDTPEPAYPVVHGGRLVFPVGRFWTVLASPELAHALARGRVLAVGEWVCYRAAPLFAAYVDEMYALRARCRADGNRAMELLCKLMLNGLAGKFAQNGRKWERCRDYQEDPYREFYGRCSGTSGVLLHHRRFGLTQHQLRDGESADSFPAITAHITAAGRMRLWQLRELAGPEHVFYCDTDSLYVDAEGLWNLRGEIDPERLGALKIEGTARDAHFRAPKDYTFGGRKVVKGVRARAVWLSDDTVEQDEFQSYDRALAAGEDGVIVVRRVRKTLTRADAKSAGSTRGWRTPLRLDEPR
ncbi:MAG: DNA polymerase [Streptosporangiaceae bacterium]